MPRYMPSATRWPPSSRRFSSLALLTQEISESTAGMLAPVKTTKGACLFPVQAGASVFFFFVGRLLADADSCQYFSSVASR